MFRFNKIINKSLFSDNEELTVAIISGILWAIGGMTYLIHQGSNDLSTVFFIIAIIFGGYYPLIESVNSILKKQLNIDALMVVAAIGAIILGMFGDAALLLFLFSLGHGLEVYALNKVKKSFSSLNKLNPKTAFVKRLEAIIEVAVDDLKIGDVVIVKPNSRIPVDGVISIGESHVDQSTITGESMPITKSAAKTLDLNKNFESYDSRHKVFAGTINGHGALEIKVKRLSQDSSLNKMIQLVKEAETQKSETQHLADKFEKYYVPFVLVLVASLMFAFLILDESFSSSFYRAMATLIAASPCALAISTPSAVLAGIARAAKHGVLIKGGKALEDLAVVDVIAFDKTGTLTEGKPKVVEMITYNAMSNQRLLELTASVEVLSDHPIAQAIVNEVNDISKLPEAKNVESITARGIKANINQKQIYIGNERLMQEVSGTPLSTNVLNDLKALKTKGNTVLLIFYENSIAGLIGVMDAPRSETSTTINELNQLGFEKLVMLTGDNQGVANAVASAIGIDNPYGNLLPEDKVAIIDDLNSQGYKIAMIGDGVNDAPALAKATLGIAMGAAGSDVALETADVALMSDKIENLPFAIKLSKKAKKIIMQNLFISLGMVGVLVPLTILGVAEMGPAVIGHEGSTIVVVLNALRLLNFEV